MRMFQCKLFNVTTPPPGQLTRVKLGSTARGDNLGGDKLAGPGRGVTIAHAWGEKFQNGPKRLTFPGGWAILPNFIGQKHALANFCAEIFCTNTNIFTIFSENEEICLPKTSFSGVTNWPARLGVTI